MKKFYALTALLLAAFISSGSVLACGMGGGGKGAHGTDKEDSAPK